MKIKVRVAFQRGKIRKESVERRMSTKTRRRSKRKRRSRKNRWRGETVKGR